jgi:hypothetical protein
MVGFQTKNHPNLGKYWRAFEWEILVYFMTIWNILWPFGLIYGRLVLFVVICYIFPNLVCLDQDKSGNPAWSQIGEDFLFFPSRCLLSRVSLKRLVEKPPIISKVNSEIFLKRSSLVIRAARFFLVQNTKTR